VHLTPRGERIILRLAKQRLDELRTAAPALVRALNAIVTPSAAASGSRVARQHRTK
jgi:hypothetical protein